MGEPQSHILAAYVSTSLLDDYVRADAIYPRDSCNSSGDVPKSNEQLERDPLHPDVNLKCLPDGKKDSSKSGEDWCM